MAAGKTRAGVAYIDVRVGDLQKFFGSLKAQVEKGGREAATSLSRELKGISTDPHQFSALTAGLKTAVEKSGVPIAELRTKLESAGKQGADGFLRHFSPLLVQGVGHSSIKAKQQLLDAFSTGDVSPRLATSLRHNLIAALDEIEPAANRGGQAIEKMSTRSRVHVANMGSSMQAAGTKLGLLGFQITNLGKILTQAVTVPLVAVAAVGFGAGIKLAAGIQTATAGFTALLGSGDKAKQLVNDLQDFAVKSPLFDTQSVFEFAQSLLAAGISVKQLVPTMTGISGISALFNLSTEQTALAVQNLNQIMLKGKPDLVDFKQFHTELIPIEKILGQHLHKSETEITALWTAGKITSKQVLDAFIHIGSTGPALQAVNEKSKTLVGQWSQLKDVLSRKLAIAMLPHFPALTVLMNKVGDAVTILIDKLGGPIFEKIMHLLTIFVDKLTLLANWFDHLTPKQQKFALNVLLAAAALGPAITAIGLFTTAIGAVESVVGALATSGSMGLIGVALFALGAAFIYAYTHSDTFKTKADELKVWLKGVYDDLKKGWETKLKPALQNLWATIRDKVLPKLKELWHKFEKDIKPAVISLADTFKKDLKDGIDNAAKAIEDIRQGMLTASAFYDKHKKTIDGLVHVFALLLTTCIPIVEWLLPTMLPSLSMLVFLFDGVLFSAMYLIIGFEALGKIFGWVGTQIVHFVEWAADAVYKFIKWLLDPKHEMPKIISNFVSTAVTRTIGDALPDALASFLPDIKKSGQDAGNAFATGLTNSLPFVNKSAAELGKTAKESTQRSIRATSPSRDFIEIGHNVGVGLAIGIAARTDKVSEAANALAEATKFAASTADLGTPPAVVVGQPAAAGAFAGTTVNVYNPVAEPASETVPAALRRLAYQMGG